MKCKFIYDLSGLRRLVQTYSTKSQIIVAKGELAMNASTPRTDPRIVRTRKMLRDALVELLEEMDIEKISVNRLTQRATINRVTFYLHYRDISDMLEKMADD